MGEAFRMFTRIGLFVLNSILMLLAIALTVISGVLYSSVSTNSWLVGPLDQFSLSADMTMGQVMHRISIGFLVIGTILILMTMFGLLGTLFRIGPLIVLFGCILVLLCGFQIYVIYVWFRMKDVMNDGKEKLYSMLSLYQGNDGNTMTKFWNNLFEWLDCCGVNAQSAVDDFTRTTWNTTTRGSAKVPRTCCKDSSTLAAINTCTITPTIENSWVQKGCHSALVDYIGNYANGFLAIAFLILFLGIITIVFAFIYAYMIRRKVDKCLSEESLVDFSCGTYAPCSVHDLHYYQDGCWNHMPLNNQCKLKSRGTICKLRHKNTCRRPCSLRHQRYHPCYPYPTQAPCVLTKPRSHRFERVPCSHFVDPPYWIPYDYNGYPVYEDDYRKKRFYYDDPRNLPMLTLKEK